MNISIDDFAKLDIRTGTVVAVKRVVRSKKLLNLKVDFGPSSPDKSESSGQDHESVDQQEQESDREMRQILSGIAKFYTPQELIGKQFPFIVNLEPRQMMGIESQGMILATGAEDGSIALLSPNKKVSEGSKIK